VLAAYNSGPGSVNKAIRRAGGNRNYWEIRKYLPLETRGYVPAFIAVNYVMNYTSSHNLYAATLNEAYLHTDTVSVNAQMRFDQISYILQMPIADLEFLNPCYKKGVIPTALDGKCYSLRLPAEKIGTFVNNQNVICEYLKTPERIVDLPEPIYTHKTHTVRKGEVLGSIARKYNCSVGDLKKWNHLKGNNIRVGQKLKVLAPQKVAAAKPETKAVVTTTEKKNISSAVEGENVAKDGKYIYHIVQEGDTLWSIASRYDGLSVEQLKKLNKSINAKSLKPGTKVKIGLSS
jgi:membrane-bound lytic murein transglycosylase D